MSFPDGNISDNEKKKKLQEEEYWEVVKEKENGQETEWERRFWEAGWGRPFKKQPGSNNHIPTSGMR